MKFRFLALLSLSILSFEACSFTKGRVYKLTILHTNDHHGQFWPTKEGELGLAPRATLINQIRDEVKKDGGHVLLLDAGDVNTGTPQSNLQVAEPDFKGMAYIGYDVMAIGNHEFDNSLETILKQREWAGFPFISANIYHRETEERIFPSHIVKELEDLKVTIFGLTTEDTPIKSKFSDSKTVKFVPMLEEAKKLVPALRKDTDVLIALTHIGHYKNEEHGPDAPGDVTLARQVNGIDLIVGGHTARALVEADIQNGTVIVQTEDKGKYVGRVDLEFVDGKVTLKSYKLIPINYSKSEVPGAAIAADPYLENILRPFKAIGDRSIVIDLGTIDTDLIKDRTKETNLGNLVTKAFKAKFKTNIAVVNSGGLRENIKAGVITYEALLTTMPFQNEVSFAEMRGEELKKYMEHLVFNLTPGTGSFPQMTGVEIVANKSQKKILSLKVEGKEMCPSKTYSMAIPDFIAGGKDNYPVIKFRKTGFVDSTIVKEYIESLKVLKGSDYAPTGYIKFVD